MMEPLLNIERAAEMLSLSPWTIRSWIRKRKLKAIKLGSRIVVEPQSLRELISEAKANGDSTNLNGKEIETNG